VHITSCTKLHVFDACILLAAGADATRAVPLQQVLGSWIIKSLTVHTPSFPLHCVVSESAFKFWCEPATAAAKG
jgi:hypothetical protein